MSWGKYTAKQKEIVGLREFANWIEDEADATSAIYVPTIPDKEKNDKRGLSCREDDSDAKCNYCSNKSHQTSACSGYLKLSIDDRWELVKKKRACFGCLSTEHNICQCKRRPCNEAGCKMKHHPTLHNDFLKKKRSDDTDKRSRVREKPRTQQPKKGNG